MIRWLALLAALLTACDTSDPPATPDGDFTRIVTLAPHLAELLFAVGAENRLVGVSAHSDYPDAVADYPVVSDAFTVDQERLALLDPDLLLAWESGMPASKINDLRGMGFRVEVIRTRGLDDIAAAIRRIGSLSGRPRQAERLAREFEAELEAIASENAGKRPVDVFFQISYRPLYTVNSDHYISQFIELCRGRNVFGDIDELSANIDVEAVMRRRPEAILAPSGSAEFDLWRQWETLPAVRSDNFFALPADETGRPTTRVLKAARAACAALDVARERLRSTS